jgi:hypothetical protein
MRSPGTLSVRSMTLAVTLMSGCGGGATRVERHVRPLYVT